MRKKYITAALLFAALLVISGCAGAEKGHGPDGQGTSGTETRDALQGVKPGTDESAGIGSGSGAFGEADGTEAAFSDRTLLDSLEDLDLDSRGKPNDSLKVEYVDSGEERYNLLTVELGEGGSASWKFPCNSDAFPDFLQAGVCELQEPGRKDIVLQVQNHTSNYGAAVILVLSVQKEGEGFGEYGPSVFLREELAIAEDDNVFFRTLYRNVLLDLEEEGTPFGLSSSMMEDLIVPDGEDGGRALRIRKAVTANEEPVFYRVRWNGSGWEAEQDKELQPNVSAESNAEMEKRYKAILLGDGDFVNIDRRDQDIRLSLESIKEAVSDEDWVTAKVTKFTTVDLDGNGENEMVLWIQANERSDYGFEILYFQDQEIYGFTLPYRGFMHLKTDGTFYSSGGMDHKGIRKLRFSERGYTIEDVSDGEAQEEKADVEWYDLTSHNVELAFEDKF